MSVADNLHKITSEIPSHVTLVAVTKTYPSSIIKEAYDYGYKIYGENRVQELTEKYEQLPRDVEWHLIGHLQTNKVKFIIHCVSLIHSVDSLKLLSEINRSAQALNRRVNCLLQIHVAQEETKFGLSFAEAEDIIKQQDSFEHVSIKGLMGMATLTKNKEQIQKEFHSLYHFFETLKGGFPGFTILSMGMSSDYKIAIDEGSTMIRVGSAIFGSRN